jgi:hypothetical protein
MDFHISAEQHQMIASARELAQAEFTLETAASGGRKSTRLVRFQLSTPCGAGATASNCRRPPEAASNPEEHQ